MRVLITGGNGFIARNFSEQFRQDYTVVSPNSTELNLLNPDRVMDFVKAKGFDYVIHAATYDAAPKHSTKDPTKVLENNLGMFFNLMRARNNFGRLIYFGSGAEFSREHWKPLMEESYFGCHVPTDQYGFSKYIMTEFAKSNPGVLNLRLFAVFGKYEDPRVRPISSFCYDASFKNQIRVHQNRFFDFMDVDDLGRIVKRVIENPPTEPVYNACTGRTIDFLSIARRVREISGKDLEIVVEKEGLGTEYSGNNNRLMQELNGFKFTPINQSIEGLYKWYKEQAEKNGNK